MNIKPMKPKELEKIMRLLGANASDVGRGIGVSRATVCRWRKGNRDISNPVATAIRLWAKSFKKPA